MSLVTQPADADTVDPWAPGNIDRGAFKMQCLCEKLVLCFNQINYLIKYR